IRDRTVTGVQTCALPISSSRSWAIAPRAQDCPAAPFELPEIDKTCVTPRIATARRNAPGRVSQLQTSNCENHPLGIFSTVFGFRSEEHTSELQSPYEFVC